MPNFGDTSRTKKHVVFNKSDGSGYNIIDPFKPIGDAMKVFK